MSYFFEYGTVHIPEDKREAFIRDAKTIAHFGGLLSQKEVSLYGKSIKLLSFPTFTGKYANFYFSYFENWKRENAGIDLNDLTPYSGLTGYDQFAKAVKALYILTELYSDTMYFSQFGMFSHCRSIIQWVRYILRREDVRIKWRSSYWKIYEQIMEESPYEAKSLKLNDIVENYLGDHYDYSDLSTLIVVIEGRKAVENLIENEYTDTNNGLFLVRDTYKVVEEYKEHSKLADDKQLYFLLELLTLSAEERNKKKSGDNERLINHIQRIPPEISVKIYSEIYGKEFYKLWRQVKGATTITAESFYKPDLHIGNETLTTEKYFQVTSDDRLYWWSDIGDVIISDEMQKWFDYLHDEYEKINPLQTPCNDAPDSFIWQRRLVELLAELDGKSYFFEDLFYEFLSNCHKPQYRTWIILLKEYESDSKKFKQLTAVLANKELREKVFGAERRM